ncbi:hypothetical protein ACFOWE_31335 [Planomonospora corallina]|uniref:Uncharacterized protein n=1 Tax=Planomonospora corallina TaxID=1806052 RepID=A0ABV8IFK4_9ACTN
MADDLVPLFDVQAAPPPEPEESAGARRTCRQAEALACGRHPLTGGRLHAEAAPHDDRSAAGRRCGTCRWRQPVRGGARSYAKCLRGNGTRVTHGAATDVRAWWPACPDHSPDPEEES